MNHNDGEFVVSVISAIVQGFWMKEMQRIILHLKIINKKIKRLRRRQISLMKVIWNEVTRDVTWELEKIIRESYLHLF